jgi:hypothetical protein
MHPRVPKVLWPLAAGATIGAAVGYYGQCQSGTCVFTATWWGGAIMGLLLAVLVADTFRASH